jgi:hypothetical protein
MSFVVVMTGLEGKICRAAFGEINTLMARNSSSNYCDHHFSFLLNALSLPRFPVEFMEMMTGE